MGIHVIGVVGKAKAASEWRISADAPGRIRAI
jgi:hypothetical protein